MIEMMYPVISLSYPLQNNLCQPSSHLILIQYCLENLKVKIELNQTALQQRLSSVVRGPCVMKEAGHFYREADDGF